MKRRTMIAGLLGLPLPGRASLAQTKKPYRISLIGGEPSGAQRSAGIVVDMDDGWKTYWRNPGDAGIPPSFDWQRSQNISDVQVLFPLPTRHTDASGEAFGYFGQVVFPLLATLRDSAQPAVLGLDMFLGICKEVCIPVSVAVSLPLDQTPSAAGRRLLMEWQQKVPQQGDVVSSVSYSADDNGPVLELALKYKVDDILVEGLGGAYFHAPQFSNDGLTARLSVANIENFDKLRGQGLRLTFAAGGMGLEQTVKLP